MSWVLGVIVVSSAAVVTAGAAAAPGAEAPREKKVLYQADFEDPTGECIHHKGGPYNKHWCSNFGEARLSVDPPMGKGNDSKLALTCHTKKALPYVSCEVPLYGTTVEPQGWDGGVSFRIYNGGFDGFTMSYCPAMPADTTVHRYYFKVPKGEWVTLDVSLDRFLYHNRRPRRGLPLERLVFAASGAESDDSVFQVDNLVLYQVKQTHPVLAGPKPPPSDGVLYRQDFNDPADFDVDQNCFPYISNCNLFRWPGGVDAVGKPVPEDTPDAGCIKIECYNTKNKEFRSCQLVKFPGDTVIEFDCLAVGTRNLLVRVRTNQNDPATNKPVQMEYRLPVSPQPQPGKWTRCRVSVEDMVPFSIRSIEEGVGKKLGRDHSYHMLFLSAMADNSDEHYLLIDNMVIRKEADAGKGE